MLFRINSKNVSNTDAVLGAVSGIHAARQLKTNLPMLVAVMIIWVGVHIFSILSFVDIINSNGKRRERRINAEFEVSEGERSVRDPEKRDVLDFTEVEKEGEKMQCSEYSLLILRLS